MARNFDGVDDQVNFGAGTSYFINTFTATAWVRPPANFTAERMILSNLGTDFAGRLFLFSFGTNQNDIAVHLNRSGGNAQARSTAGAMTAGSWNFVASSYDGSDTAANLKLFSAVLGSLAAEVSYAAQAAGSGTFTNGTSPTLRIASRTTEDAVWWSGDISDVRLYNSVLTLSQIREVQYGGNPATPVFRAPLQGIFRPELDIINNVSGTITGTTIVPDPWKTTRVQMNTLRAAAFKPGLAR